MQVVSLRLPDDMFARIKSDAIQESVRRNEMILWSELVREYLNEKWPSTDYGEREAKKES